VGEGGGGGGGYTIVALPILYGVLQTKGAGGEVRGLCTLVRG